MWKIIASAILFMTAASSSAGSASDLAYRLQNGAFPPEPQVANGVARMTRHFGPFRVIDEQMAELDGVTDSGSPAHFIAMTSKFPQLRVLRMANCPGTIDDVANLRLGRMIHARGMATIVPSSGSVRSGAVEIFIAGVVRTAERGAEFAVHTWSDRKGVEMANSAASDPISQAYLAYYFEMGLSKKQARDFYLLTNSANKDQVRWLNVNDMAVYVDLKLV